MLLWIGEHQLHDTLPISHAFAQRLLRGNDLDWFNKEYQKMFDIFKDSSAFQWMEQTAREQAQQKAKQEVKQMRQEMEQQMLEERKQAEKKLLEERKQILEERKQAEKKLLEERKQILATLQKNVGELVSQRFPTLERLAKMQVRRLKEPEPLQQLMLHLSLAHDSDEAQEILFSLGEKDEDKDE
jgi:hypothetical protein